MRKIKMAEVVS